MSGANQRSAAISQAVATSQPSSTMRRSQQSAPKESKQAPRCVYFNVGVYDMSDPDEPEQVEQLQAGKTYTLVITCEEDRSAINQHIRQDGQRVTGRFYLAISYSYDVSVTTPTRAKQWVPFEGVFDDQSRHDFTLPADFPTCTLTINILFKTPQRPAPMSAVQYPLPVCGQKAPPSEIFKIAQIDQRLPEKTAILLVESAAQRHQVRLRGWSEAGQQLDKETAIRALISIEELQKYREKQQKQHFTPEAILNRLTYFSRHNPPALLKWLQTLLHTYQEPFNLIIVDLTEQEIPWELVEIQPKLYLGACARVVRWLGAQFFEITRILSAQPDSHVGPIISYLDTAIEAELIHDEQAALQRLTGTALPSLTDLNRRLQVSLDDVGMIYIGCHGRSGQQLLQQDVPELSSIMLERLYRCASPRLTVFINACESARTIKKSLDDRSNFVDAFLGYCASGFIGTLIQVDIATASTIAGHILRATLQPGGVQIAEMLRILRKTELEKLKQMAFPTRTDYYRFIDTFMYVYYGNPLARLRLYAREEVGQ